RCISERVRGSARRLPSGRPRSASVTPLVPSQHGGRVGPCVTGGESQRFPNDRPATGFRSTLNDYGSGGGTRCAGADRQSLRTLGLGSRRTCLRCVVATAT